MQYCIDQEKIVWRNIEQEVIILNLDSGFYYGLNKTAALVWTRLTEKKTSDEISQELAKEYGLTLKKAKEDVLNAIQEFTKESLVLLSKASS